MNWEDLSSELKEKAQACETTEELAALAESVGIELSDEQLSAIYGGVNWACPTLDGKCGKWDCDTLCIPHY